MGNFFGFPSLSRGFCFQRGDSGTYVVQRIDLSYVVSTAVHAELLRYNYARQLKNLYRDVS